MLFEDGQVYGVALFDTVSHVMKAEKIVKEAGIPHKIIPVPRVSVPIAVSVCASFWGKWRPSWRRSDRMSLCASFGSF